MMSLSRSGRVVPAASVQLPAVRSAMAARIAATSSRATWALPACGTGTRWAPVAGKGVPAMRWRAQSGWLASRPS